MRPEIEEYARVLLVRIDNVKTQISAQMYEVQMPKTRRPLWGNGYSKFKGLIYI